MPAAFRLNFARRPFRDERPLWLFAGIALALGLALFAANLRLYLSYRKGVADVLEEIARLEERQRQSQDAAAASRAAIGRYQVSTLAAESHELTRIVEERRFSWLELLARLERTLPGEVRLARLAPKVGEDGSVSLALSLVGRGQESVVRTLDALSRQPDFADVRILSETSQEEGVPEGRTFEVAAIYKPPRGRS